jgi:preprotein translocase subunit SecG
MNCHPKGSPTETLAKSPSLRHNCALSSFGQYFQENLMHTIVLVIHVLAALGVIALVLLQHGKGADMGAAFGSGASGSLFGVTGASNFLSRATAILITVFFTTSITLAYLGSQKSGSSLMLERANAVAPVQAPQAGKEIPAAPAPSNQVPK